MSLPPTPPKWILSLFRWYCNEGLWEYLEGDLFELFERRVAQEGLAPARRKFLFDVLDLIRPFTLRRSHSFPYSSIIYPAMFFHNLKFIFRNLRNHAGHSAINILGLALALLATMCIFIKLRHDLTYDKHLSDRDRIYRVVVHTVRDGNTGYNSGVPGPVAELLPQDYPGIEALSVVDRNIGEVLISLEDSLGNLKKFNEEWAVAVWPSYFEIVSYDWIQGDPQSALAEPNTCVITESLAMKYFGNLEVIGKRLTYNGEGELVVKGLIKDPPLNTNFPFDLYLSKAGELIPGWLQGEWLAFASYFQCFVKLGPEVDPNRLEQSFPAFVHRHNTEKKVDTSNYSIHLQALDEVHTDARYDSFGKPTQSRSTLWALAILGFFILFTACINFVNLNIAMIVKRTKEVGLRKVLGSKKVQIFRFFLLETTLIIVAALGIALVLLPLTLEKIQFLLQEPLTFSPFQEPLIWIYLGIFFLITLFMAGFYPSMVLARTPVLVSLKNTIDKRFRKGVSLRKGLIITQFTISQLLVICTLVAMQQMDYIHRTPLGFNKEAVIETYLPNLSQLEQLFQLKTQIAQHSAISSVSITNNGTATNGMWRNGISYYPQPDSSNHITIPTQVKMVDPDYLGTYGITLIAGENFSSWDTLDHLLVNQAFVEQYGQKAPHEILGDPIEFAGNSYSIRGVVQDFNTQSLHQTIEPVMIASDPSNSYTVGVKIAGGRIQDAIQHMEGIWERDYPKELFQYSFLDEKIAEQYEAEERATLLFQVTAAISIFIGLIGLLGLISLAANSRVKEIGIRKVLGASISQIVSLFTMEFFWLVVFGFLVAAPLGWYLMKRWLEEFAYKISLGVGSFAIAFGISAVLMGIIVGLRAFRSASINPVEAIRSE